MNISQLRQALEELKRTDPKWQASEAQADIGAVIQLLAAQGDITIQEFCEHVVNALSKKAGSSKTAKAAKPINEVGVERYLGELNAALDDNAAFEAIVKRAEKDKSIKLDEALQIALKFTGSNPSKKTKAAAWKAVLDRQIADRRSAQRIRQVPGLF